MGEQYPPAGVRLPDEGIIAGIDAVGGVRRPAAIGARASQVNIENEPGRRQGLLPRRFDADHIAVAGPVGGRGRLAVDQQAAGSVSGTPSDSTT